MATLAVTRPRPRGRTCVRHVGGAKISIVFYTGQAQSMRRVLRPAEAVARAVESFPSIYDTEVLLLVLLLHASTRSQRQGHRAVWFPKKWLSKNAGRMLRRKLFGSQNPGIKSRPPGWKCAHIAALLNAPTAPITFIHAAGHSCADLNTKVEGATWPVKLPAPCVASY